MFQICESHASPKTFKENLNSDTRHTTSIVQKSLTKYKYYLYVFRLHITFLKLSNAEMTIPWPIFLTKQIVAKSLKTTALICRFLWIRLKAIEFIACWFIVTMLKPVLVLIIALKHMMQTFKKRGLNIKKISQSLKSSSVLDTGYSR